MDSYSNPNDLFNALSEHSINFEDCQPLPDIETAPPVPKKAFFTAIGALIAKPYPTNWLIKDYFECDKTVLLLGASGAGKSFVVLDMALSIAAGIEWQGHQTKQGAVFYVCGEGRTGIMKRALAWSIHNNVSLNDMPFFISESAVILPNKDSIEKLHHEINASGHKPILIIFDTLARCLDGDENTAKDIGAFIQSLDTIRTTYNSTMLVVHHSGKDETRGARGSSAIKGALDTEMTLSGTKERITLTVTKQKDHDTPQDKSFSFESVATNWLDDDMNIIYSAVLVGCETGQDRTKRKINANTQKMLDVLKRIDDSIEPTEQIKNLFKEEPEKCPDKVFTVEQWQAAAYEVMTVTTKITAEMAIGKDGFMATPEELNAKKEAAKKDALRKAFNRGLKRLESDKYIGLLGDYVWFAYAD